MAAHIILSAIIIFIATIASVCSECCDFNDDPCTWSQSTWSVSNEEPPDLTQYPNFTSTQTDPNFMYIEDWSGSTTSLSTFSIPNDGTVISFDYFLDSPIAKSQNYFTLEFFNNEKSFFTMLTIINTHSSIWRHVQLTCDSGNDYCCGSIDNIPCEGTLRIAANVDGNDRQALIAIDTIGTTCSSLTTYAPTTSSSPLTSSPPTTTPPTPTHLDCCFFYDDPCGSSGDWFWSKENPSIYTNCEYDNCVWTNRSGAEWVSPLQYNVTSGTTFTFQYSFSTSDVQIQLGFKDSTSDLTFDLGLIPFDDGYWPGFSFNCTSCCGTNTLCDGYVTITSLMALGEAGMDNFGRDTLCYGTVECCLYDDPFLCGSESEVQDGVQWQWSGERPSQMVPYPGSDFMYFEVLSNNTSPLSVSLKTGLMTISKDSFFYFRCYDINIMYLNNTLNVYFTDIETGSRTEVYRSLTSDSYWQYCGGDIRSGCVGPFYECSGYLEFVVNVNVISVALAFAVDYLDIDKACEALG